MKKNLSAALLALSMLPAPARAQWPPQGFWQAPGLLRNNGAELAIAAIEQTSKKAQWQRREGAPMNADGARRYFAVTTTKMANPSK